MSLNTKRPLSEHYHEFEVRDYECDMAHVVNNAVYHNYLEHARLEFLKTIGIGFGDMARRGIGLVVTRVEADFKSSLVSGDRFVVRTSMARKGRLRFQFIQSIHRLPDDRLMLSAVVTGTALNERGRPEIPLILNVRWTASVPTESKDPSCVFQAKLAASSVSNGPHHSGERFHYLRRSARVTSKGSFDAAELYVQCSAEAAGGTIPFQWPVLRALPTLKGYAARAAMPAQRRLRRCITRFTSNLNGTG